MTSVCKSIALLIFLAIPLNCLAGEKARDAWFGEDKIQHFGYSAFLAGGTAVVANRHFDNNINDSITIGLTVSISLGAIKETIDYRSPGQAPSRKDLIWDIVGALTGAALASLIL